MISFGLNGHRINIKHGGQTLAICKRWLAGSMAWIEVQNTESLYETFSVRCAVSIPAGTFLLLGLVPCVDESKISDDKFIMRLLENDCVQTISEDELRGVVALVDNELRQNPFWGRKEAEGFLGKMPEYKELEVKPS